VNKDQGLGAILFIISIIGIILYGWLVFLTEWGMLVLQVTGFLAVSAVLVIVAWIGYTLATTPPPQPLEDLISEEELEPS
jgi:predicted DNA-binding transcriptional regulator